jgi:alpha-L-fucosidase
VIQDQLAQDTFEPTWESLQRYRVPSWYQDGKFGIFIHWGVYCVPAFGNEWYPRNMYKQGSPEFEHHVKIYGPQSKFGYKDFIPQLTAEHFDADAWVQLFKDAGARFVVPVAEHHDGFPMYDCSFSEWTAAKMGPKRDIIGELAAATRQHGLDFGVSSHRAEHWWFMDGGRKFDSDVQDPAYEDFYGPARMASPSSFEEPKWRSRDWEPRPDAKFLEDWLARTCELVDKYRPQLIWFDWWIEQIVFQPYLQRFATYYYNKGIEWGRGTAINYKLQAFPDGAAVFDVERGQFKGIRPTFWQNDTSVSKNSWGYIQNHDYKTARDIIGDLVDVVSKNGALLLNVGPKPDGTIPEPEVEMLRGIGRWLAVNGEAIYDTRPWQTYGEGPTEVSEGSFTDTKRSTFTGKDFRFTAKDNTLYAVALDWPDDEAVIESLSAGSELRTSRITDVSMLGSGRLEWTQTDDGLHIKTPAQKPCDDAFTFKIQFE